MDTLEKATRKNSTPVKVYCLPEERSRLKELAESTGYTLSTYMLRVGMGYEVKTILDNKRVEELSRINGDLSRLGNLLKLWLSDDPRTAKFGEPTIRAVLSKIESTQDDMRGVIRTVVLPKTKR